VLTRVRFGCGEEQGKARINRLLLSVEEAYEGSRPRRRQLAYEDGRDVGRLRPRYAHDADATATGRRRLGDDGVGGLHDARKPSTYALFLAWTAAIRRLMFHCWAIESS